MGQRTLGALKILFLCKIESSTKTATAMRACGLPTMDVQELHLATQPQSIYLVTMKTS
jgi:hypothetical protein